MVLGLQGSDDGSAAITLHPGKQVAVGSNRWQETGGQRTDQLAARNKRAVAQTSGKAGYPCSVALSDGWNIWMGWTHRWKRYCCSAVSSAGCGDVEKLVLVADNAVCGRQGPESNMETPTLELVQGFFRMPS